MTDRYPRQNPQAAWRTYDGEAVVISPEDSTLHTLNAVATLIWEAADGRTPIDAIAARICREFEVDRERAIRDAEVFVAELAGRGLLTLSDAPAEGA